MSAISVESERVVRAVYRLAATVRGSLPARRCRVKRPARGRTYASRSENGRSRRYLGDGRTLHRARVNLVIGRYLAVYRCRTGRRRGRFRQKRSFFFLRFDSIKSIYESRRVRPTIARPFLMIIIIIIAVVVAIRRLEPQRAVKLFFNDNT